LPPPCWADDRTCGCDLWQRRAARPILAAARAWPNEAVTCENSSREEEDDDDEDKDDKDDSDDDDGGGGGRGRYGKRVGGEDRDDTGTAAATASPDDDDGRNVGTAVDGGDTNGSKFGLALVLAGLPFVGMFAPPWVRR
jgi:hypothetical protein